ncbi:MAG: helix-turn-helix domain-containing protein [Verrucomicrobiaceae bacterium]|nr:helix-turn-helix domain-containing protein [Verrucomicrobiaceae bacterium]
MSKLKKFSERVSSLRAKLGLSQEPFAKLLGVSRNYVSMIEQGREPSASLKMLIERLENEHLDPAPEAHSPRARLRLLREKKGYSQAQFAKALGYTDTGLYQQIEEGRAGLSEKMAAKAARLLGVELDDLTNGSDHPPSRNGVIGTFGAQPEIQLPPGMKAKYVPLLSMAQCGAMMAYNDEAYTHDGFLAINAQDTRAFAVTLAGDSMIPRFEPGDVALVYPSKQPKNGDVVIARLSDDNGGDVMLKLYQAARDDVTLSSYNPAYPPMTFPRRAFAWIYPIGMVSKILH